MRNLILITALYVLSGLAIVTLSVTIIQKDSKIKKLEKITYQQQTEIDNLTYQRNQCIILYRGQ